MSNSSKSTKNRQVQMDDLCPAVFAPGQLPGPPGLSCETALESNSTGANTDYATS